MEQLQCLNSKIKGVIINSMKEVIIIGAGIGGLVAGNLLAKKGHKVTIFESHSSPGGYTAGFIKKGFYFESGTLSLEGSPSVFKVIKDIGIYDKIEFIRQKTRHLSTDYDYIFESYDELKKTFYITFPSQKKNFDRYFKEIFILDKLFGVSKKALPYLFNGLQYYIMIIINKFMLLRYRTTIEKYKNKTINQFTDYFFDKNSIPNNFFNKLIFPKMSTLSIGSNAVSYIDDYWTIKGGMQSFANVFAKNYINMNGHLMLNSYVDKIITKDDTATGVISKKKKYNADYIIAACDYKKTFLNLLDNTSLIPENMLERIKNVRTSESVFTVYLGLNISNEHLRKRLKIPYVVYHGTPIDFFDYTNYFNHISLTIYSPSLVNPNNAPRGNSSIMIQTITPHNWMNNWGSGDKKKYMELKEETKKMLIDRASKVIPELKDSIIFEDAATPITYERYTHNSNGASAGWNWNPNRKFYRKNPFIPYINTPVKNLLIGSSWALQYGSILSALSAAYMCVKKIK